MSECEQQIPNIHRSGEAQIMSDVSIDFLIVKAMRSLRRSFVRGDHNFVLYILFSMP